MRDGIGYKYREYPGDRMTKPDWNVVDGTVSDVIRGAASETEGKSYVISFAYAVDGLAYAGNLRTFAGQWYTKGEKIAVRYNPAEPGENDMDGRRHWAAWFQVASCAAGVACLSLVSGAAAARL
jgi:hypothetical protein